MGCVHVKECHVVARMLGERKCFAGIVDTELRTEPVKCATAANLGLDKEYKYVKLEIVG